MVRRHQRNYSLVPFVAIISVEYMKKWKMENKNMKQKYSWLKLLIGYGSRCIEDAQYR